MCTDFSFATDSDLLIAAGRGGPSSRAWPEVHGRLRNWLHALVANSSQGSYLPQGIREDAVQETFLLLYRFVAKYDPERGTMQSFVRGLAYNAIKKVARDNGLGRASLPEPFDLQEVLDRGLEPAESPPLHDESVAADVLDEASKSAPGHVAEALAAIYWQDMSFAEAARLVGVGRSSLRRSVRTWVNEASVEALVS